MWINEPERVFVARDGRHELTTTVLTDGEVRELVERMLKTSNRRLDVSTPFVDAMLPSGHRLHVVLDGITRGYSAVNVRKFVAKARRLSDLVELGSLSAQAAEFLDACVVAGPNILVVGGTPNGSKPLMLPGVRPCSTEVCDASIVLSMSDALQIIVPSLLGVVAPVLLFLQSRANSKRESEDRQLERKSDEQRRAHELELKKIELAQARDADSVRAEEAARQRERERYLRFLSVAQEVGLYWMGQLQYAVRTPLHTSLQSELAASYEDALLSASTAVRAKLTEVKGFLDQIATGNIEQTYQVLQGSLMGLRDAIRDELERSA